MEIDKNMNELATKSKIILTSIFVFFFLLSISAQIIYAQSTLNTTIQVVPESVRAEEVFSVGLTSSDIDLDRSTITWFLNEKIGLSGIGKIGFSSWTGPVGTEFRIKAEIITPSGSIIIKNTVVRPQEIDFLWRSYSYTPPFYLGRSLAPSSSFVSITAMPNMADTDGNILDPRNLVYTWTQGGIMLGGASGYGKQTIILENGQIPERLLQIQVSVSSLNKTIVAKERIRIPLTKPRILFYERLPLHGVLYNNILRNVQFKKEEMIVRAEPYFFSKDDVLNNKLLYEWKLSGEKIDRPDNRNKNEIVFRRNQDKGEAKISLEILNDNLPLRILQKAKQGLIFNIE